MKSRPKLKLKELKEKIWKKLDKVLNMVIYRKYIFLGSLKIREIKKIEVRSLIQLTLF